MQIVNVKRIAKSLTPGDSPVSPSSMLCARGPKSLAAVAVSESMQAIKTFTGVLIEVGLGSIEPRP